jgi:hypothetical protein
MKPGLLESADGGEADFFKVFRQTDFPHTSSVIWLSVLRGVSPKLILVAKSIFVLEIQRTSAQNEHHF